MKISPTLLLVLLALLIALPIWVGTPCPCERETDPPPYSGTKTEAGFDFTWYSDVNGAPGRQNCYQRSVTNNHRTSALKFDWEAARLKSDALAPHGGVCRQCEYYGDQTTREGPLNYGRGNASTPTSVYEGRDEPGPPKTLIDVLQVDGFVSHESYSVSAEVTSTVAIASRLRRTYAYTYTVEMPSDSKVAILEWHPAADAAMPSLKSLVEKPASISVEAEDLAIMRRDASAIPFQRKAGILKKEELLKVRVFKIDPSHPIALRFEGEGRVRVQRDRIVLKSLDGTLLLEAWIRAYGPRTE